MQQKQDQLLQIIKEELIKQSKIRHVEKVIPLLTPNIVEYLIVNDLPIYEDQLKEILFEQSKHQFSNIINQMDYDKNLKAQQEEMEKQIFLKKTQKRKKKLEALRQNNPELYLQKTQQLEPATQMQQLQNNFAKLLSNFTQIVAAKVVQEIKQPVRKTKKPKRPSTPEFDQSLEDKKQEKLSSNKQEKQIQNIISHNQQIDMKQKPTNKQKSESFDDDLISNESEPFNFDQQKKKPNQFVGQQSYLTSDGQQSMTYSQSKNQSQYQKNFDDYDTIKQNIPGSVSMKYPIQEQQIQEQHDYSSGDLESYDDIEPLQNNKSKFQHQISHLQQSSDDYPDDFIEESNDKFQQNASNFYKPKQQVPVPDQVDFDDDIEDLLL